MKLPLSQSKHGSLPRPRKVAFGGFSNKLLPRLIAAFLVTGASLLHAQNMVPNGGFENGIKNGWSHSSSGGALATFLEETVEPYAGAKALKVVTTNVVSDSWRVQTLGRTFTNLGIDKATTIRFRARASEAGTRVRFVMQNQQYAFKEFTLSTAWTDYTWNHTTRETSPRLRIQYPSVGTVWLDEVSVTLRPTPQPAGIELTVGRDGYDILLGWDAPQNITSLINVYRHTSPQKDGRVHIAALKAEIFILSDRVPSSSTSYWYWISYTDTAGMLVEHGPFESKAASVWQP